MQEHSTAGQIVTRILYPSFVWATPRARPPVITTIHHEIICALLVTRGDEWGTEVLTNMAPLEGTLCLQLSELCKPYLNIFLEVVAAPYTGPYNTPTVHVLAPGRQADNPPAWA
jgi:hypothetical protein